MPSRKAASGTSACNSRSATRSRRRPFPIPADTQYSSSTRPASWSVESKASDRRARSKLTDRARTFAIVGLAAFPPVVLLAMNSLAWGSDLDGIVLGYRLVIYVGLFMALASIALAIRQMRRGGSYTLLGLSLLIALGFIVWVGPDAYLDFAAVIAGP